jgi:hypothetical protein
VADVVAPYEKLENGPDERSELRSKPVEGRGLGAGAAKGLTSWTGEKSRAGAKGGLEEVGAVQEGELADIVVSGGASSTALRMLAEIGALVAAAEVMAVVPRLAKTATAGLVPVAAGSAAVLAGSSSPGARYSGSDC